MAKKTGQKPAAKRVKVTLVTGQQLTLAVLPALVANGDTPVAFRFRSTLGTWSVDDVFVDPFQRG